MKKKSGKVGNILKSAGIAVYLVVCMTMPAMASEGAVDEVLKPIAGLKTILFSVISLIGALVFAWNLMQFSSALKDRESSTMQQARLGMAGGVLMCGVGAVLALLGIS